MQNSARSRPPEISALQASRPDATSGIPGNVTAEPGATAANHVASVFVETERDQGDVGILARNHAHLVEIDALCDIDQNDIHATGPEGRAQAGKIGNRRLDGKFRVVSETRGKPLAEQPDRRDDRDPHHYPRTQRNGGWKSRLSGGRRHRHPESHEGKYAVCCQRLCCYLAEITALIHAGSRDAVHIRASC
jgi:hypothetical protein